MTTSYTIPGVAEPIPATSVAELLADHEAFGSITDLAQTNWYRFVVQAGVPARVTFTAAASEYTLHPYLRYIDKGSADAHIPEPETTPTLDVFTYTFLLAEDNELFLAVVRLDSATGNSGYTLNLAIGPIDKGGSADAHEAAGRS